MVAQARALHRPGDRSLRERRATPIHNVKQRSLGCRLRGTRIEQQFSIPVALGASGLTSRLHPTPKRGVAERR